MSPKYLEIDPGPCPLSRVCEMAFQPPSQFKTVMYKADRVQIIGKCAGDQDHQNDEAIHNAQLQ